MENVTQGISVVDADMNLVAWNHRYLEMFDYPDDLIFVGRDGRGPRSAGMRERGEFGASDAGRRTPAKRLALHALRQRSYAFQRERARMGLRSVSAASRWPAGGYVTTYTDITEFKHTEQALLEAKLELEAASSSGHDRAQATRSRRSSTAKRAGRGSQRQQDPILSPPPVTICCSR